jgi:hypothetical protein
MLHLMLMNGNVDVETFFWFASKQPEGTKAIKEHQQIQCMFECIAKVQA